MQRNTKLLICTISIILVCTILAVVVYKVINSDNSSSNQKTNVINSKGNAPNNRDNYQHNVNPASNNRTDGTYLNPNGVFLNRTNNANTSECTSRCYNEYDADGISKTFHDHSKNGNISRSVTIRNQTDPEAINRALKETFD